MSKRATNLPEVPWAIPDVAAALNVHRRTIERLRSAGKLPRPDYDVSTGKTPRPRWKPETIRAWLANGGTTTAA